jgi:thymidylate kinase
VSKIILIVGGPGAGKSTLSRLVAERYERSVYHEADRIRESVVKGFAIPQLPYSPGNLEQFKLGRDASTFIAQSYCDAGFTVVVDDSFACHVTAGYTALMDDERTVAILLAPEKEAMIARMAKRQGPLDELLIGLVRNGYYEVLREIALERWNVIDNTDLTIEETVERVHQLAR